MSEVRRHYWDSSVFCSFFKKEAKRWETVRDLLNEAHAGRGEIITSSFALVEVLKLKDHKPVTEKEEKQLTEFFEYPFIKIVNADRNICERARLYCWRHSMASKDAIHMATAEFAGKLVTIHGLFSWDEDFTRLESKHLLNFPITVPFLHQSLLKLEDSENEK